MLVKTATGTLVGPLIAYASTPIEETVTTFLPAPAFFVGLNLETGFGRNQCIRMFESADCSGQAYLQGEIGKRELCESGSRLWALTSFAAVPVTIGSYFQDGVCISGINGPISVYTAAEVVVPGYPFAAPLQIAYE